MCPILHWWWRFQNLSAYGLSCRLANVGRLRVMFAFMFALHIIIAKEACVWASWPLRHPANCLFACLFLLLLTYLRPWLPVEHRPSTTPRHRTLFWAALVIPDQLVPCCFSSASVSRLQLLRGRPLFLFPCVFQVRAWRVVLDAGFLRVVPIRPHWSQLFVCLSVFVVAWRPRNTRLYLRDTSALTIVRAATLG